MPWRWSKGLTLCRGKISGWCRFLFRRASCPAPWYERPWSGSARGGGSPSRRWTSCSCGGARVRRTRPGAGGVVPEAGHSPTTISEQTRLERSATGRPSVGGGVFAPGAPRMGGQAGRGRAGAGLAAHRAPARPDMRARLWQAALIGYVSGVHRAAVLVGLPEKFPRRRRCGHAGAKRWSGSSPARPRIGARRCGPIAM